jgi:branched-chain amino acid transport system ATP-binding protein
MANTLDPTVAAAPASATTGQAALQVENVSAGYGRHTVLREVSLSVDGEIVSLLGHNGAGKSTLLRAISGSLKIAGGDVRYHGSSVKGWGAARVAQSGVALVPQGRGVFPTLSIEENLRLGAGVARHAAGDRRLVSMEFVLELFPMLAGRLKERAGTLSGGQQQMVAIGTALMTSPTLLLLDEPSTGLAPVVVQTMLDQIRTVHAELGIDVLIVEQNIHEALRVSDRAYVLRLGAIVREGPASTLLDDADIWDLF